MGAVPLGEELTLDVAAMLLLVTSLVWSLVGEDCESETIMLLWLLLKSAVFLTLPYIWWPLMWCIFILLSWRKKSGWCNMMDNCCWLAEQKSFIDLESITNFFCSANQQQSWFLCSDLIHLSKMSFVSHKCCYFGLPNLVHILKQLVATCCMNWEQAQMSKLI